MTDVQKEEGQKTIVSFVVGLLIGGLLVWAFTGNQTEAPTETLDEANSEETANSNVGDETSVGTEDSEPTGSETTTPSTPAMEVGDGVVIVNDQPASTRIALESVTFPMAEGWIGVRDFSNETLGPILGVVRFSQAQGLVPETIILQYPTQAGRDYAVVFFTNEAGERQFNLASNVQVDRIFATFRAQ